MIELKQKVSVSYPDGRIVDCDVSDVLASIMAGAENEKWSNDVGDIIENCGHTFDYVRQNVPTINWSGVSRNGFFLSYTNLVAVKIPLWYNLQVGDIEETINEYKKRFPYIYTAYVDLDCAWHTDIILVCRHDNIDPSQHKVLCRHIERELLNRVNLCHRYEMYAYIDPKNAHSSYSPDLFIDENCPAFHFTPHIDCINPGNKLDLGGFDAIKNSLPPVNSLEDIKSEVLQHYNMTQRKRTMNAARYFAYRARLANFNDNEAYQAFLECFNGRFCEYASEIMTEFYAVYRLNQ